MLFGTRDKMSIIGGMTWKAVWKSQTFFQLCFFSGAFLVVQEVKNLHGMRETWVRSLAQEDPLEEGMATDSSILAWTVQWAEESGRLQSVGL